MYKIDKIIEKIQKYKYISFDIFDTLIKRNVEKPSDIFSAVNIEYEKIYGCKIDNFEEIRKSAEIRAKSLFNKVEPNIDDIYNSIELDRKKYIIEDLKKIELNLEYKFCQLNKDFYPIYDYCVKKGKIIVLTSDMYLKKEHIGNILKNAGIDSYLELFVSSELQLRKHDGTIWKYILKKININPNEIIHIGDSKRSDMLLPRFNHIDTIGISKKIEKTQYYNNSINMNSNEKLQYDILQNYINNNIDMDNSIYYRIGYEVLGPILYGYSKWLLNNAYKKNVKKIFFLAREGALLKKAFDQINDRNDIKTKYICVSRKSTRPALIRETNNLNEIYKVLKIKPTTDISKFFKDLNIDYNKYQEELAKIKCYKKTKILEFNEMEKVYNIIKNDIKSEAEEGTKRLLKYLSNNEFETDCIVSDVGWAGSMQKALIRIYKEYNISGYYIAQTMENEELDKYAYFDDYEEIRPFVHLFENLFLAQHGTTLGYGQNNYEPIFDKYEYTQKEKNIFLEIQNGGLKFVHDFNNSKILENLNENVAKANVLRLGLKPTLQDVKIFQNIPYIETKKRKMIEMRKLIFYIFDFKKLKEDFYDSGWKIGFLKKLLKFDGINYYELYKYGKKRG